MFGLRDRREKGAGMRDHGLPFQTLFTRLMYLMMGVYFRLLGSWCYSGWSPFHIGGLHKTFKKRSKCMFLYGGRGAGRASRLGLEETTDPDGLCGKQRSNYIPNDHWPCGLGGKGVALLHLRHKSICGAEGKLGMDSRRRNYFLLFVLEKCNLISLNPLIGSSCDGNSVHAATF